MKKRYIIYLCLLGLIALQKWLTPVLPVIQLPGEVVKPWANGKEFLGGLFGGGLTNTFIATLVTFVIIILIALALRAPSRTSEEVPTGIYNFFEMLLEMAYNYVEGYAGKWTRQFFPYFMTFILWIVIANWMELVPGVDSIGKWENLPHFEAEKALVSAEEALHDGETSALAVLNAAPISIEAKAEIAEHFHIVDDGVELTADQEEEFLHELEHEVDVAVDEENIGDLRRDPWLLKAPVNAADEKPEDADWTIVPYLRAAATDLNFTIAVALISVIMTQYYGMKAQGMKYWKKFFVWDADKIAQSPLAVMDTGVGILEFISEIFKIVSFAFRLLGNIFAGQVLLFVIGALLPVANLLFWHLEFGVGLLQGVVFALLTLTFMAGATEEHGHDH